MSVIKRERNPPKEGKIPYKMIFFDMDGTLIDNVSGYQEGNNKIEVGMWPVVFNSLGLLGEYQQLRQKFRKREQSSYEEWTIEACGILKANDLTEAKFLEIVARQPFMKGAKETVEKLHDYGYKTAVISGGFGALARRAQVELGVDDVAAHCDLEFGADGKLKDWVLLPCDYEGKTIFLERMAAKYGFVFLQCVYVGDGVNDVPVFRKTGLSIAFHPGKQEVRDAANIVVDGNDLRLILKKLKSHAEDEIHRLHF